jgi:hypothetical protein
MEKKNNHSKENMEKPTIWDRLSETWGFALKVTAMFMGKIRGTLLFINGNSHIVIIVVRETMTFIGNFCRCLDLKSCLSFLLLCRHITCSGTAILGHFSPRSCGQLHAEGWRI